MTLTVLGFGVLGERIMQKKGFTLIELLVVIAIIALLLAILLPGLNKVKDSAKSLVCRTNIRSLTTGLKLHVESNDQKLLWYDSTPGEVTCGCSR